MIHHKLDVKDNDQNIVRPLILRIADQVKMMTGIEEDAEVIYPGFGESRAQYVDLRTGRPRVALASEEGLLVEVTTRFEEGPWSGMAVHRQQHTPFFHDPVTPLSVKPGYQEVEATISFTYVTHSFNEAQRWRNAASTRVSQWGETQFHESSYQYIVPRWVWAIAKHVHELRELRAPYNETFEQYLLKHLSSQATQVTDQAGQNTDIAIRETQGEIQGIFDFTSEPEPVDKNNDQGSHRVRFGYKVWFSVPTFVSVEMPLVIHNTVVDAKFIPKSMMEAGSKAIRASSATSFHKLFEGDMPMRQHMPEIPVFRSPGFDSWKLSDKFRPYRMYGSFLVGYTAPNQTVMANLKELGHFSLSADTLAWMSDKAYEEITTPYLQPFYIALYENEEPVAHTTISIDKDLNVVASRPLNMRKRYRLVIFLLMDVTKMNHMAFRSLREHPDFTCTYLRTIQAKQGDLNRFMAYVDLSEFGQCVIAGGPSRQEVFDSLIHMNTVLNAGIVAERR